jgi:hypothetical protein
VERFHGQHRIAVFWEFSPLLEVRGMKKVCVCVVLGLIALAISKENALALPPFNKEWTAKYVEGNGNAKFVEAVGTAKCNVCHMGASKKDRNEYGKAVSKYLTKAKYNEIKEDEAGRRRKERQRQDVRRYVQGRPIAQQLVRS